MKDGKVLTDKHNSRSETRVPKPEKTREVLKETQANHHLQPSACGKPRNISDRPFGP